MARDRKYAAYGVAFWGECWGFKSQSDATKQSTSNMCQNDSYKTCGEEDAICSGTSSSSFVFLL